MEDDDDVVFLGAVPEEEWEVPPARTDANDGEFEFWLRQQLLEEQAGRDLGPHPPGC